MSHRFVARSSLGPALPGTRGSSNVSCSGGTPSSCGLPAGGPRACARDPGGGPVARGSPADSGLGVGSSSSGLPAGCPRACVPAPDGGQVLPRTRGFAAASDGSQPSSKRARFQVPDACLPPTPEVSKAISAFSRYPHRRPAGLCPNADGSLNIHEIWSLWGRFHGVSKNNMLQFIAEHAFHAAGHRRFLLRSDCEGQTWVTVVQRPQRFCQRRHHRRRGLASRTLDSGEKDFEGDTADLLAEGVPGANDLLPDAVAPRNLDAGKRDIGDFAAETRTLEFGGDHSLDDAVSISSGNTPGSSEVKSEPALDLPSSPTLLCKDEEVLPSSPVSHACAPVPGTPGLLDGFSFLFTETDNFGCPVVPGGDDLSPFSDTVPASFVDTLEGEHVDQPPTANSESSGTLDHGVPCPGPPALVRRVPVEPHSMFETCDKPIPSAIPPVHSLPPSTPHAEGHHNLSPPAPGWFLKVTLDHDTRRMPLLCTGTPPFHDVLSGVCTLFHLTPFDPAASPILSYRDLHGDTCTLTHTTYHDALPLFSATRIIRLSLAATHLAFTRPSTLSPDAIPPGPEHLPSNTSRYLPPAHAVAGLERDQLFLSESRRRDLDHSIARWRTQHSDNPYSRSALHALREIFPNDSAGGLAVLRTCFPRHSPGSRNPSSTKSVLPPPRQCSVPGAWSAEEILSAAQWIMGNPGLSWSPTPGAGGHKQIRIRNAIINHWNSGVVNVQGRDAQLVSEKLLSTRQVTEHHSPVSDSGWSPVSRRRNRFPPSPTARISSTDCRSPPASFPPPQPYTYPF